MGNKSSKHAGEWPPYSYPGSHGQPAPFFPPGFPIPPGQVPTGMGGPVIPHMYPGMPGSQAPFPPPPSEKGFFGRKKKRSQSEHYPGGYMSFPQPQFAPPPNPPPVVPEPPARSKSRKKPPRLAEPVADTSMNPSTHRSATPFGRPPQDDSDETSEDEDEGDFSRRRSRRTSHRRRAHSEDLDFLPTINGGTLRRPLPPPPKDLYEMTPYKDLLALPKSTALLDALSSSSNPRPTTNVTHLAPVMHQVPVAQAQPAPQPAPAPEQPKKKSLFRRLTGSKRKHEQQQQQAPPQARPAVVAQAPIILPVSQNPASFLPAIMGQAPNQNPIISGGSQSRASISSTHAPPPVASSQAPPNTADFRLDTARFSDAGFGSSGLTTGGMASGGFPTGTTGGFGAGNGVWIPPPPPSPEPEPDRNINPQEPYYFSQTDPKFASFMNHSSHRVIYHDAIYPTATHVHEAMKYIDRRPDLAEKIRRCPDVLFVYPTSAQFHDYQRPDWGQVFLEKMEEVLILKFSQHDSLGKELIGTYPRPLIYADERDTYWGQGPDGSGENQLGRLLMQVRRRLMQDSEFQGWMNRHGITPSE